MGYHMGAIGTLEVLAHDRRRGGRLTLIRKSALPCPEGDSDDPPDRPASPELAAMRTLSPFDEKLLFDVFVVGISYHQIGRELGVPASTIKRRIDRRIETLGDTIRDRLRREGGDQEDPDSNCAGAGVRLKPKPSNWSGKAAMA